MHLIYRGFVVQSLNNDSKVILLEDDKNDTESSTFVFFTKKHIRVYITKVLYTFIKKKFKRRTRLKLAYLSV